MSQQYVDNRYHIQFDPKGEYPRDPAGEEIENWTNAKLAKYSLRFNHRVSPSRSVSIDRTIKDKRVLNWDHVRALVTMQSQGGGEVEDYLYKLFNLDLPRNDCNHFQFKAFIQTDADIREACVSCGKKMMITQLVGHAKYCSKVQSLKTLGHSPHRMSTEDELELCGYLVKNGYVQWKPIGYTAFIPEEISNLIQAADATSSLLTGRRVDRVIKMIELAKEPK
jgi:hypothetical protein